METLMPSPIDVLLDPLTLAVIAMYGLLFAWEHVAPGRPLPRVRGWTALGLVAFAVFLLISTYLPLLWGDLLAPLQVLDLSAWPTGAAAAVGVLAYEFGGYAYHRAMHRFTPLWRLLHQMHHSSERLDVASSFWFSPLDMVGWTVVPSVMLTLVGLSPASVTAALLFITFLGIFQHANLKTPRWLGWFIQRPESHSVHHERGVHQYNYADLPLIDMLFGTFRNPRQHAAENGFWHGASRRIWDMLLARDVSVPAAAHTTGLNPTGEAAAPGGRMPSA
jgi:sterol desaturase/sphingolipid hydroxylase (fatty acid hydroxylase superfamily)